MGAQLRSPMLFVIIVIITKIVIIKITLWLCLWRKSSSWSLSCSCFSKDWQDKSVNEINFDNDPHFDITLCS